MPNSSQSIGIQTPKNEANAPSPDRIGRRDTSVGWSWSSARNAQPNRNHQNGSRLSVLEQSIPSKWTDLRCRARSGYVTRGAGKLHEIPVDGVRRSEIDL